LAVSVDYVARETASNLWRNRLMTVAAILTVAVSLSLVGAALLLKQGAAAASQSWQRGTQVRVWLQPEAAKGEINAIGSQLTQLPYVHSCVYRNKPQNYAEAKTLLSAEELASTTVNAMPTYFGCAPNQLSDAKLVQDHFTGQPGVRNVTAPFQQIHAEQETVNILKWVFLALATLLLLSAAVLILNTIRMAIFARRREVSVMKLVGATNWFIRIPFMSEGLIQGLIGSAVAVGAVTSLHAILDSFGHNPGTLLYQIRITGWQVFWIDLVVVLIGVIIGSAGSAIAIRRFLDV
jgi:cell division transport system permease protein